MDGELIPSTPYAEAVGGGLSLVALAGMIIGGVRLLDKYIDEPIRLREQVELIADREGDNNGVTSGEEWVGVYRELELQYGSGQTVRLTRDQCEQYLSNRN